MLVGEKIAPLPQTFIEKAGAFVYVRILSTDSPRISSKLRSGLCLVLVAVAVLPWGEAWGEDDLLRKNGGPITDLNLGGREEEGMYKPDDGADPLTNAGGGTPLVFGGGARPGEGDTSARLASSSGEAQQQASSPILNYDFTGLSGLLAKFNNQPK